MITIRGSAERGRFDHGWLDTRHTFSFGGYVDRRHMGFRSLRVINEDIVAPGAGFPQHPHAEMEIITYIVAGALAHRDTSGGQGVIRRGDVQHMSAGTGIEHSEFNASNDDPAHLLQIWVRPKQAGVRPMYQQRTFADAEKQGVLRLLVSPDGRDGSLEINQDALLSAALLSRGQAVRHALAEDRHAWVQLVSGALEVNGVALAAGDGAAISAERELRLSASSDSEVLLFDLN